MLGAVGGLLLLQSGIAQIRGWCAEHCNMASPAPALAREGYIVADYG